MKLGIVSDIHEDAEALQAASQFLAAETDVTLALGDFMLRPYTVGIRDGFARAQQQWLQEQPIIRQITARAEHDPSARIELTPEERTQYEALTQSPEAKRFLGEFVAATHAHTTQKLSAMRETLDTGKPFLVIPGNYDPAVPFRQVFGDADFHLREGRVGHQGETGGLKLFGYGGTPASDPQPEHLQMLYQIGLMVPFDHTQLYRALTQANPDIAMIHNPPKGLCDVIHSGTHVGTEASRQWIREKSPALVLSGHIHESGPNGNNGVRGVAVYDNPTTAQRTYVVNPGNLGRADSIDPKTLESVAQHDYGTLSIIELQGGNVDRITHFTIQPEQGRGIGPAREMEHYRCRQFTPVRV